MKDTTPQLNCSQAIVKILENMGVTHVFGVPGAKIDSLFIALKYSKIKLAVKSRGCFSFIFRAQLYHSINSCISFLTK